MINYLKRTWCEINLDHIKYNIKSIREKAKKEVIAVVKADAYGHGDKFICRALAESGVKWFAVSNIAEAVSLRKQGFLQNILILGYTPPECVSQLCEYHITQTVYDRSYARILHDAAKSAGKPIDIHIKVDTGMNRIGYVQDDRHDALEDVLETARLKWFCPTGIFTHFSHSDSYNSDAVTYTQSQIDHFNRLISRLEVQGITFPMIHAQNSAGIIAYEEDHCNFVRAGIILYGLAPSDEMLDTIPLKPAMELKSIVTMVKRTDKGAQVSYGRTFTAASPMRLATVAIGYADGYSRLFSSRADVLIHGVRCPVVGRVCMDQIVVDATGVPDVEIGDTVTLFGSDGTETIPVEELAALAGTINYEIVCSMGRRVPRIYLKNGNPVHVEDYLLG